MPALKTPNRNRSTLWILGAILLGLAILGWLLWMPQEEQPVVDDVGIQETESVEALGTFVRTETPPAAAADLQDYLASGLRQVASALEEVIRPWEREPAPDPTVGAPADRTDAAPAITRDHYQQELDLIRNAAVAIDQQVAEEVGADVITHVRDAFLAAATIMESLKQQQYPALQSEVQQVRLAAESVNPAEPLVGQREVLHQFFQRSHLALESMGLRPVIDQADPLPGPPLDPEV